MGNSCFKPEVADKEQPVVAPEATQEVNKYQQLVDRLRNLTTLMEEKQLFYSHLYYFYNYLMLENNKYLNNPK